MSEQQWLKARYPSQMRKLLGRKASVRKLRLFACACVRQLAHLLPDERSRRALEVGELYADGLVDRREMAEAEGEAMQALNAAAEFAAQIREAGWAHPANGPDENLSWELVERRTAEAEMARAASGLASTRWQQAGMWEAARLAVFAAGLVAQAKTEAAAQSEERSRQCDLLRDIFGNPFRPLSLDRRLLAGSGRTLRRLAEAIYEERTFDELPILADALEEAGCTDRTILDHCRGTAEHVRGCWVVDLVLGKE
ncbi:MAG: hypothetical protein L0Z62_13275 [Gemmataceae bacterium]|nr:hypothetical protein [Gemmataceae bacterium]